MTGVQYGNNKSNNATIKPIIFTILNKSNYYDTLLF